VDPQQNPPKTPLPGRVVLAPFRWLAPRINSGLTKVEEDRLLIRVQKALNKPEFHPVIGGLGDGSGFGIGFYAATPVGWAHLSKLWFQAQGTTRRYAEIRSGVEFTRNPEARFQLGVEGRYRWRPEEDFWGAGINSSRNRRSTYNLQEGGVGAVASVSLLPAGVKPKLRVGVDVDYSHSAIKDGRDRRFARISQEFASEIRNGELPGFIGGASLLAESAFVEFDGRDSRGNPEAGVYARASVTNHDSTNQADYGFINKRVDVQGYLPLGTKRRTLVLRALGDFNDAKGGSAIPFFRLARLGDQQTLRGYDTYRFHGRNALMGTLEYRWQLARAIKWIAFTDIGQVYNLSRELSRENLRATWGTGVAFTTERSMPFRIMFAKSPEGSRIFFSFAPSF
jgi:outer membrane protein assembly factor BamA